MSWIAWTLVTALSAATVFAPLAYADTVSCSGKRGWQRELVQEAVHDWFRSDPDPDALVFLIQAEHGIAACASRGTAPARLHTPTLTRGLALDQLGAALLANELEWRGVMPRPEHGLAGEFFRVRERREVRGMGGDAE
ncbi:MAG: hypothetical protein JRG82_09045 [Deltaproteobacteria bacterium]|nr:hypothetical protein [Deltaproteobacteria bacterium]